MGAVRSAQLSSGVVPLGGVHIMYATPFDLTTIVKDGFFANPSSSAVEAWLLIATASGGASYAYRLDIGARSTFHLVLWLVLPERQSMYMELASGPSVNYWLSGTELLGDQPNPPQQPSFAAISVDQLPRPHSPQVQYQSPLG